MAHGPKGEGAGAGDDHIGILAVHPGELRVFSVVRSLGRLAGVLVCLYSLVRRLNVVEDNVGEYIGRNEGSEDRGR